MKVYIVLFLGALCCAQCPESEEQRAQREMEAGLDAFAVNLYQEVRAAQAGANLVLSPLSAAVVLALTWMGARGRSAQQLGDVLHLPLSRQRVALGFGSVLGELSTNQSQADGAVLRLANRLYLQSGFEVHDEFQSVATESFRSAVQEVNFADSEAARQAINGWVANVTENRITDLIPQDALSEDTRLVLVNALYFSAQWLHQFEKAATEDGPFHVAEGQSVNASLMHGSFQLSFARLSDCNASALVLPYRGGELQSDMVILLPDAVDGLERLESNLGQLDLSSVGFETRQVAVTLPKFTIETSLPLTATLQTLGVDDLFTPQSDLSGISEEHLSVSDVIQKAYISVNENGTEAAAATAVVITTLAIYFPAEFVADHPFLYILRIADNIAFIGRVVNPAE